MDAQQFLEEFKHIANAPAGIGKLRELVIQLAISGRLVERTKSEASASQAIEAAVALRREYERELDLRTTRMNPPLDSRPFPIPDHWHWVRLEQLCLHIQRGKGPKYVEKSSTHVISQKCIQWAGFDMSPARFVADDSLASYGKERFLCEGDLLWNSTGTGTVGRVAIYHADAGIKAVADSHVTVLRLANCAPRYLWCVIASPWVQSRIEPSHPDSLVSGTTQQVELNTSTARALPIPLPPLEEQSRIVAKVDELMALCDQLEAQQQERFKLQSALRHSTLQAVASSQTPRELQAAWARLADNFGRLFHASEDVTYLRHLILDLAANGFVSQPQADDSDPLSILGQASLQQRMEFSARELRQINALPELTYENGRCRIPLGRIVKLVSGQHLSPEEYNTHQEGIPYITGPAEFKNRKPSPAKWTTERKAIARFGDVLITVKGSGVGKTALCDLEELAISRQLMAIRALADLDRRYLSICIDYAERSFQEQKFGIAIPGIGRDEVLALSVLLPSIEEQGRIVCRVDELMRLCDSLESQLRSAQKTAERLVITAISSLTGIAVEQEEESMKAPQTELIAPLRLGKTPDIKAQAPLATILARHRGEMSAKDLWQRFGGDIDAFYAQLKTEVTHGWIVEPAPAEMREKPADTVSA